MSAAVQSSSRFSAHELAEAVSLQPSLFSLPAVQDRELIATAPRFTGKIATKDEARCAEIARRYLQGESRRDIAEAVGCSRNTIPVVIRELERAGKLEPLKEMVLRDLGEAVREQVAWNQEIIQAREVTTEAAAILKAGWVGAGVYLDKVSGPAVSVHLHEHRVQAVGEDVLKRYQEALNAGASAVKSDAQPLISNDLRGADTFQDTLTGSVGAGLGGLGAGVILDAELVGGAAEGEGGGIAPRGGGQRDDGNQPG